MNAQLPTHLQNRQSRNLAVAAVAGINSGSPAHISIAGNRFTLIDDAGNEKPIETLFLDVCVIDANGAVSKIYFDPKTPFVPGGDNSNPPICWSDNGIGASAQASVPQNTSCQLCPQNAWGSAVSKATGAKIKACNDVKKVAVIVPGIEMVFLLRIPPASLKNWGKYCNTLAGHGVDLPDAVTRLEFESQGILEFTPMGYVDAATAASTDKAIQAKATDNLVGRNDRPWGGQGEAAKVAYAAQRPVEQIAPSAPAAQPMAPPPQPFGQAPTPQVPPMQTQAPSAFGGTSAPMAGPFAQPAASAPPGPFAGPAATQEPVKRTRAPNKKKEEPTADDGIPPFLRREQPAAAPALAPNPTQFGMQSAPAAPDAGVQAALDAAFRLPT